MKLKDMACPLCKENNWKRRGKGKYTVWFCQECPAVVFEYYDDSSIKRLLEVLSDNKGTK